MTVSPRATSDSRQSRAPATRSGAQSRLTAILFTDAAGYSRAMNRNEMAALQSIQEAIEYFVARIQAFGGEPVNFMGDGLLATFESVAEAIKFAITIQDEIDTKPFVIEGEPIGFRIGIHLGEIFTNHGKIYGDSVNIASRIEGISPVGGVCVSDLVYRAVRSRSEFRFEYLGPKTVKNVPEPVEVYRVYGPGTAAALKASPRNLPQPTAPRVAHRRGNDAPPSIAVLPFKNLSNDPSQDFYADGVTDDIITNLTHFRDLDVIARGTSFMFRDPKQRITEIGQQIGASYVAQGSVRRINDRVRITVELADAARDRIVWSQQFDRPQMEIFDIQNEIANVACSMMSVRIEGAERVRASHVEAGDLRSYDLCLRGLHEMQEFTAAANARARGFFEEALQKSPGYGRAMAALARAHSLDWRYAWVETRKESLTKAADLAGTAVVSAPDDARGYAALGFVSLYQKQHDRSLSAYQRASQLNPNDAGILAEMADALHHSGKPADALPLFERAIQLNPFYPDQYLWDMAGAYVKLRRFEDAIACIHRMHNITQGRRILACCYAHLGRDEEAREEAEHVRAAQPGFSADAWAKVIPDRRQEDIDLFISGLKKAGL